MLQRISQPVFLGVGVLASLALVGCGGSSSGRPTGNTGGTTGSGGAATGAAGATTTGSGGSTGSGGAAGASAALPCTANPTTQLITNFLGVDSMDGGVTPNGSWGTTGQLTGTVFGYGGTMTNDAGVTSKVTATIDKTAGTLTLSGTVNPADYSGGGLAFATCVDSTNWTGVQFTLGGTADGCNITFQLQTESEEPPSNKGTCASNCYNFPQIAVTIPATAGTPTVVHFTDLANTGSPAAMMDFEQQMFGLQWQFTSAAPTMDGSAQAGCMPSMTISDVMWTTN